MSKYESQIKQVAASHDTIYSKLSDLNNLASMKEKINDPATRERIKGHIPEEKLDEVQKHLESLEFDTDTVSMNVPPVGKMAIKIIEREPSKCIKFESVQSPIGFNMWIQVLPVTTDSSKMKLTIEANVNPFLKAMIDKPLREGVDKLADMLAMIPYNN